MEEVWVVVGMIRVYDDTVELPRLERVVVVLLFWVLGIFVLLLLLPLGDDVGELEVLGLTFSLLLRVDDGVVEPDSLEVELEPGTNE